MSATQRHGHWELTLEELVSAVGGKVRSRFEERFHGIGTDTRVNLKSRVFFALKGDTHDAHDYLEKAVASGAGVLIVHRDVEPSILSRVTVVEVADTLTALQGLGRYWRRKMKAQILGLTGTNGKTTTKEFAAALIGSVRDVHYSKGSFNNHWGVPISLLGIDTAHEVALIEMGMNHPGELTTLAKIAEPDVVVVTMVGRGHLEGLGSIEGVAAAKQELYDSSPAAAIRVFNLENPYTRKMAERYRDKLSSGKFLAFAGVSSVHGADWPELNVSLEVVEMSLADMRIRGQIQGVRGETVVPVFGTQNITNLMAAACLAIAAGLTPSEIWTAFPLCKTVWGRNQWVHLPGGARVLFDGYNANPESMRAALENFSRLRVNGRKYAILGEMREMGESAPVVHREIGEIAARAGFAGICFFGPSGSDFEAGLKSAGFSNSLYISNGYEQTLAGGLPPVLDGNDIVLIKGSRGMRLENALLDLKPLDFQTKT